MTKQSLFQQCKINLLDHPNRHIKKKVTILSFFFFFFFGLFRVAPVQRGDSQARGPIRAVAAGLLQSLSNSGSKLCLQPMPQLPAMPDL